MTTQATNDLLLAASLARWQLTGQQPSHTEPDAPGELSAPTPPDSSLWTDGLPDPVKIKNKMERTVEAFVNHRYPPIEDGQFRYLRLIHQRKLVQAEFYATMSYYESLLYAAPVLPLRAESSTTTVLPYQPATKRKRGRPSTGGRKPRPTTRKGQTKQDQDDLSY